jgi:O-antigen/teichoic acid export membrane protein
MNAPHGPPSPYAPSPYAPSPYAANPYAANPYAAPQVPPAQALDGPSPLATRLDAALYTPNHVGLATFLGTPFAGSVLMAINEHRVGRTGTAVKTAAAGFVGTGLLLAVASLLPDGVPRFPISIGPLLLMVAVARSRQDAFVRQHHAMGGKRGSGWAAAGIGLLSAVVVLIPFMVVLVAVEMAGGDVAPPSR